ncbi:MAG: adenylosuccinate lyase [Thaumarchaeota archaeon]|nr:MAG: adenylosuccinate lyase [Nitrososphaerota archaeon]
MDPLETITPIDGRYREKLERLSGYFSEYALIRERATVELRYLAKLIEEVESDKIAALPLSWREVLRVIEEELSIDDAKRVKELERELGHDIAALVRFLREKLHEYKLDPIAPYIHLGLTSEDVNNLAYSRLLLRFNMEALAPALVKLMEEISSLALEHVDTVMLGRTHGVPAVPTTFGKFLANYAYRIAKLSEQICFFRFPGKLGGAVGDHSALKFVYPEVDWIRFSKSFVESLGLEYVPASTQVIPHDKISDYLMKVALLDSILANFCRDLWIMSSLGLLLFGIREGEVHSSTMPHKSNPILLENAEGAFDLASESLAYISRRLLQSRLQRDLSDSIIKRFYGLPLSLTILGITNLRSALSRMIVRREEMLREVENHPEVLAEAYQVYLRRFGVEEAYEIVQDSVKRGWDSVRDALKDILPEDLYEELMRLKPSSYIGEAEKLTLLLLDEVEKIYKKITDSLPKARS